MPSKRAAELASRCGALDAGRDAILAALDPFRFFTVGKLPDSLLHQIRQEGATTHIFFCNTDRENGCDASMGI